jgi:uncharacterized 2Fe-2S/4Fe-4S cluster protein (DUF4445 family)
MPPIERFAAYGRGEPIDRLPCVPIVGNTAALHLAAGANPASLGKYPYKLAIEGGSHLRASDIGLGISPHGLVYLPPVMSAYVGADITSGMLATRLAEQGGAVLFVDIGTNGEMVLASGGHLTATSTVAGPAFEGMNIACGMRASRGAGPFAARAGGCRHWRAGGGGAHCL